MILVHSHGFLYMAIVATGPIPFSMFHYEIQLVFIPALSRERFTVLTYSAGVVRGPPEAISHATRNISLVLDLLHVSPTWRGRILRRVSMRRDFVSGVGDAEMIASHPVPLVSLSPLSLHPVQLWIPACLPRSRITDSSVQSSIRMKWKYASPDGRLTSGDTVVGTEREPSLQGVADYKRRPIHDGNRLFSLPRHG